MVKSKWTWTKDHLWIVIGAVGAAAAAAAAYDQGTISADTEHRQLRAYLGIIPLSDKQEDVGRVALKNFGLTPASNVRIFGESKPIGGPLLGEQLERLITVVDAQAKLSQVVFPSDSIPWEFGADSLIDSQKIQWNTMPSAAFYTYGRLDYEDVFGKQHQTRFCVFSNHGQARVNHCPSGNSAD